MPRRGAARWSRVLVLAAAGQLGGASRGIGAKGSGSGSSFPGSNSRSDSSSDSSSRSGSGVGAGAGAGAGAGGGPGGGGSGSYGLREWGGACSSGGGSGSGSSTGIVDGPSSGSGSGSATVMKLERSTGSAGGGAGFLFAATRTLGNSSGAARRANQSPCGVMKPASRPRAVPKTNVCTLCVPRMPSIFACEEDITPAREAGCCQTGEGRWCFIKNERRHFFLCMHAPVDVGEARALAPLRSDLSAFEPEPQHAFSLSL